jgi:hypothetical protein
MKILAVFGSIPVAIVIASALFLGGTPLNPDGGSARADAATVIDGLGCTLLAADSGLPSTLFTDESHSVATSSGNTTLTCRFDIPDGEEPDKALKNTGFLCGTFLGITTDSQSIATPGGNATLVCHINPSSP